MNSIYPWQVQHWRYLFTRHKNKNLPHALLITGIEGLGKLDFANAFAELLLCNSNNKSLDIACGQCKACNLLKAHTHPDLLIIQPEAKDKMIKVDQIRELTTIFNQTAQQAGYKIAIIAPAEKMNIFASNALLKTLEEPIGETILILVTTNPAHLPATIRSRCQQIKFSSPDIATATNWLQTKLENLQINQIKILLAQAQNAPLKALEFAQNNILNKREELFNNFVFLLQKKLEVIKFAEQNAETDLVFLMQNLLNLINDMIKLKQNCLPNFLINFDKINILMELCNNLSQAKIFLWQQKLLTINKYLLQNINLNKQMLLEKIAFELLL